MGDVWLLGGCWYMDVPAIPKRRGNPGGVAGIPEKRQNQKKFIPKELAFSDLARKSAEHVEALLVLDEYQVEPDALARTLHY